MNTERERKLTLSDPGRDAAGDEIDLLLQDAETIGEDKACEDSGYDSFLERLPAALPVKRPKN